VAIDRLVRIYELIEREGGAQRMAPALSVVAAQFVAITGASIAVMNLDQECLLMSSSNDVASELFDLESTVREGPTLSASREGVVAFDDDLGSLVVPRWPVFSPLALELGVCAVFGFPVQVGARRMGALTFYRDESGSLGEEQLANAFLMASVVTQAVLTMRDEVPFGVLAEDLEGPSSFDFTVYQAVGMLAVQASRSVEDALVMLRSHAFGAGVSVNALALSVVARRATFDAQKGKWEGENGDVA
jgi:hypothetical protein